MWLRASVAVKMSSLPRYEIDRLIKEKLVKVAWRPNKAGQTPPIDLRALALGVDGEPVRNRGGKMSAIKQDLGPPARKRGPLPPIKREGAKATGLPLKSPLHPALARCKSDIRRMRREYRLLCEAQAPIERVFWELEQRKAQLADRLANEGASPFCRPRGSIFEPGHTPVKVEKVKTE